MELRIDGISYGNVSSTPGMTPRPQGAEVGPIDADLPAGYHTVEFVDSASTAEFDINYLRVVGMASHCHNLTLDPGFGETDVDCGGPDCGACGADQVCEADGDCASDSCVCPDPMNDCATTGRPLRCEAPEPSNPCAGYCANPESISFDPTEAYQAGEVGTGTTCRAVMQYFDGIWCGNFVSPKQLIINGTPLNQCQSSGVSTAPPPPQSGGYCIQTTAGDHNYASYALWDTTLGAHGL